MESVARPCSLVELLRRSIISAIGQTAGATGPSQWRVVVVDRPSLKIISTVLKMHAILEQNVLAVQLITKNRQPYPDADAVYVLIPCAESIAQVIDDFTSVADDAQRLKYSHAHLFFTGALSDSLFSRLSTSPAAPYIKGIAELFVEYNPIESRVFLTTPSSKPFYSLYSPKAADMLDRDLDASSDRLLSAIASLGIHPYVRYYRPPEPARIPTDGGDSSDLSRPYLTRSSHQVAEAMANRLQDKLNDYYAHERRKAENCRQRSTTDLQPSTVIVLDRSVDMYAPLVHEFTYQAMAHDLIGFENGDKYVYTSECANGETQQVEAELAESTDPLWEQMRHMHISSVSQTLIDRLDRLVSENVGIKAISSLSKKPTLHEMRAALSELPEFKRLQASYTLHIDLAVKCLEIAKARKLALLSEFENELIARPLADSEQVEDDALLEPRLIALLDDHTLDDTDRIRLLLLYIVHVNGGLASDRRRLEEVPQCLTTSDKCAAVNLRLLGVPTDVECKAKARPNSSSRYNWNRIEHHSRDELGPRFVPAVKSIIGEQIEGTLSSELFPWVQESPPEGIPKHILNTTATSLRSHRGGWETRHQENQKPTADRDKRGTLIVYIAGGATFGEMRAVYEMAQKYNRQVYIGSTHAITPRGFLTDLKGLHL